MRYFVIFLIFTLSCQSPNQPIGIAELAEIVKKRELHLVEYRYTDYMFLHKKDQLKKPIRFIVKVPVKVSAAIDLRKVAIDSIKKSIVLPIPTIVDTSMAFEKAEVIKVRDGLSIIGGRGQEVLLTLQNRMEECKNRVAINAIHAGIIEQAKEEAEDFINDLLFAFNIDNINYQILFSSIGDEEKLVKTPDSVSNMVDIDLEEY